MTNINAQSLRFSKVWKITRADGTVMRLTDHNADLVVLTKTYTPVNGFQVTSRETEDGNRLMEMQGVVDDAGFSLADLVGKRYLEAEVQEWLVDWKYSWRGPIRTQKFWMGQAQFDSEAFTIPLEGAARFLRIGRNKVIGKTCVYKLFAIGTCNADPTGKVYTDVVVGTVTSRREFQAVGGTIPNSLGVDRFADGELIWTSGPNAGFTVDVKSNTDSALGAYTFTLHLPASFEIGAGDEFTVKWGCERTPEVCEDDFDNLPNFGAEPHTPGSDVATNVDRQKK